MVATLSILGDIVERIGEDHVSVTTLVGAGCDAGVYRPTPAAARAVQDASGPAAADLDLMRHNATTLFTALTL
ncbi:MAG: zinc ABC transporter substrate-binding protein [Cyanobacteria bacterium J06639_1]